MARRLNTRLLVRMLIFVGVPVIIVALVIWLGFVSTGNPVRFYEDAQKYADSSDWVKAWDSVNQASRAGYGRNPDAQFLLARIALHQNPPAVNRAVQALKTTLLAKPDHVEAERMLVEIYINPNIKYWKEGAAACDRLMQIDPTFGRGYVWAAFIDMALAANEPNESKRSPFYESAIAHCRAGIEKSPDTLELYRMLASAYDRLNQSAKIDEVLDLAVSKNPTLADAYILKAGRLMAFQKYEEADTVLQAALKKCGENARLFVALGEIAVNRKNPQAAIGYFTKAIALDRKNEASYIRLAGMYRLDNMRDEAQKILTQGLQENPESLPLKAEQTDLLLDMGETAKADALIEDMSKTASDAAVVNYLRGKRALRAMQVRQAITYLEQSRERQPSPQTSLLLARAYQVANELGAAQRELNTLTSAVPGLIGAWRMLADVSFRLRDLDKAALCARTVLDANPDDTEMRLLMAQTLMMRQKYSEALRETQTAADRDKDNVDPLLLLADLQIELRHPADAEKALLAAVAVNKASGRVYQRLQQFYRDTNQPDKQKALMEEAKKVLPKEQWIVLQEADAETLERELKDRAESPTATPMDLMSLAVFYQRTDRVPLAKDYLHKAMAKATPASPDWRQAWQQLFLLELATDETFQAAADLILELRKADPTAVELLYAEPVLAMGKGQLDQAAALLRALTQSPQGRSQSQAYFLLGQVLTRQHKYEEAVTELGRALELAPQLLSARLLLGRIYMRQGNLKAAVREATEALKFDPHLVPALDLRASAAAGLTNWAEAIAAREDIRQSVPANTNNLMALAALYIQARKTDKAEEMYKNAYAAAPNNSMLVRGFADFYAETSRPLLGEKIVDDYAKAHEKEAAAWIIRAEFTAKTAGADKAEEYYRKAIQLDPKNAAPLVFLADQYARNSAWDKAAATYREAIKLAPDLTEAKRHLADVYMLQGKLADARQTIEEVLKAEPKDAGALVVAGRIASREEKPEDAQRYMEKALELEPDYGEAKVRLAELFAGPGPEKAAVILKSVDPSDPSFEKAMLLLSDIDTRRGQLMDAVLDLRRLLDFRPTSTTGRLALASLYIANREPAKATEILKELSAAKQGEDPGLLVILGDSLMREGKAAEAQASYEKALLKKPDSSEALVGLARSLVAQKKTAEAIQRISRTMNQFTDEVWPRLALAAVYETIDDKESKQKAFDAIHNGLVTHKNWEAGYVYLADILRRNNDAENARKVLQTGLDNIPNSIALRTGMATMEMSAQHLDAARKLLEPLAKQFNDLYGTSPEKLDKLRPYMLPIRLYSLILFNLGQAEESLNWGMKLWAIDPTDVANANNMAWILATKYKRLPEARKMVDRCKMLVPNQPQVLDTDGWIYFLEGKNREALASLQDSIKYGDSAEAHYHLGRWYEENKRPEEALTEYEKALQMGLSGESKDDAEKRLVAMKNRGVGK
jgi:tetratricopeptide (TPR) repeat protein